MDSIFQGIQAAEYKSRFKQKKKIGEGSYGTVFMVEDQKGSIWALKEVKNQKIMMFAEREAISIMQLDHPNIIKIQKIIQVNNQQCFSILMEYCELGDLSEYLSTHNLTLKQKLQISSQLTSAIVYIHSKELMHRDLKPNNVLLKKNLQVKLCDFGMCRKDENMKKTKDIGNNMYRDPSISTGSYTKLCDVYALGLVIYYIFTSSHFLYEVFNSNQPLESQKHILRDPKSLIDSKPIDNFLKRILYLTLTVSEADRASALQLESMILEQLRMQEASGIQQQMNNSFQTQNPTFLEDKKICRFLWESLDQFLIQRISINRKVIQKIKNLQAVRRFMQFLLERMKQTKTTIQKVQAARSSHTMSTLGIANLLQFVIMFTYIRFLQIQKMVLNQEKAFRFAGKMSLQEMKDKEMLFALDYRLFESHEYAHKRKFEEMIHKQISRYFPLLAKLHAQITGSMPAYPKITQALKQMLSLMDNSITQKELFKFSRNSLQAQWKSLIGYTNELTFDFFLLNP